MENYENSVSSGDLVSVSGGDLLPAIDYDLMSESIYLAFETTLQSYQDSLDSINNGLNTVIFLVLLFWCLNRTKIISRLFFGMK